MSRTFIGLFRVWLQKQTNRQDSVGGFARDFLRDEEAVDLTTLSAIDRHLKKKGVEDKVLVARDRAWREFVNDPNEFDTPQSLLDKLK